MSGIQRHLDGHGFGLHIDNLKAAPALFGKHNLLLELVHKGLDVAALLLVGDQNALRGGRDHHIVQAHSQHGYVHLVNDVDTGAGVIHFALADHGFFHRFGQRVPCA